METSSGLEVAFTLRDASAEDVQLVRAPDERDRAARRPGGERLDRVGGQRVGEALRFDLLLLAEGDGVLGQRVRGGAHEHLSRLRRGLQASGGVDDLAGDEQLSRGADARRRLAGLDPDPDLERLVEAEGLLEAMHAVADREARRERL